MRSFHENTTLMKLQIKYQKMSGVSAKARHYLSLKTLQTPHNTIWFTPICHTVTSFGQALIQQALNR